MLVHFGKEGIKMKKRKILTVLIAAAMLLCSLTSIAAYASFGSGVSMIASKTQIIKTAKLGAKIVFSELDIKQGLLITDLDTIKITALPKSSEGTLMFAGRRVSEGMEIKRRNIPALVFVPASAAIMIQRAP